MQHQIKNKTIPIAFGPNILCTLSTPKDTIGKQKNNIDLKKIMNYDKV